MNGPPGVLGKSSTLESLAWESAGNFSGDPQHLNSNHCHQRLPPAKDKSPSMAILYRPPTSILRPILPASTSTFDPTTCGTFLSPVAEEEAASSTSNHYFAGLPPANLLTVGENDT